MVLCGLIGVNGSDSGYISLSGTTCGCDIGESAKVSGVEAVCELSGRLIGVESRCCSRPFPCFVWPFFAASMYVSCFSRPLAGSV